MRQVTVATTRTQEEEEQAKQRAPESAFFMSQM